MGWLVSFYSGFNGRNVSLKTAYTYSFRYPDLASFLRERWEDRFLQNWDANDLIVLLHTWQRGDISKIKDGGDLQACLSKISAKGLIMPSKTDLYFPVYTSRSSSRLLAMTLIMTSNV